MTDRDPQYGLFDEVRSHPDGPVTVVARRTDPDTSHEAAAELELNQKKLQASVVAAEALLNRYGSLTDFQLLEHWAEVWPEPFSESLPRKARHWAREAGLVRRAGYAQHLGRRVLLWEAGRDEEFLRSRAASHE